MTGERIPWFQPLLTDADVSGAAAVIRSGYINDGPRSREFERVLAQAIGAKHAVVTTSGTVAIALALLAVGVGPGDEVIIPALTFIGTATAVALTGARPVIVDVEDRVLGLDPARVEAAITPRTRALLPVHLNGRAADIDGLRAVTGGSIAIVEDAAEALGSRTRGRGLGTLGEAGATSFAPTKLITTGQGGMAFTDDDDLALRMARLKDQGRAFRDGTDHETLGFNFKFTDLQAALGLAQAADLDRRLARQIAVYRRYEAGLAGIEGLELLAFDFADGAVPLWTDVFTERRDALVSYLAAHGIDSRPFWDPIHLLPAFHDTASRPVSERRVREGAWLPAGPGLQDEQIDRTVEAVRTFFRGD